jgi:beta-aspartyl-dipeptidase (metallo-type)
VAIPDGRGGFRAVPPAILFRDLLRLTTDGGLDWPQALAFVTSNVARVLGLSDRKGAIAPGMDADLALVGEDGRVVWAMATGRVVFDARTTTRATTAY